MKKVLVLRSPESDTRPQRLIADAVVKKLQKYCTVMDSKDLGWNLDVVPDSISKESSPSAFYSRKDLLSNLVSQIVTGSTYVNDVDAIFVVDAEMPVLPVLKYISSLTESKSPPIIGMFHSSSVTPGDFFYTDIEKGNLHTQDTVQLATDIASIVCCDKVVVATNYLRQHLLDIFSLLSSSGIMEDSLPSHNTDVVVTGLPLPDMSLPNYLTNFLASEERVNRVKKGERINIAWAHRMCDAKNVKLLYALARPLFNLGYNIWILNPHNIESSLRSYLSFCGISYMHCPTKEDYYATLACAHVVLSTATLETFGYSIIEGVMLNCIPVVPDTASYKEMYNSEYRYTLPVSTTDSGEIEKCVQDIDGIIKQAIQKPAPVSLSSVLKPDYIKVIGETGSQAAKNIVDVIQQAITTD